MMDFYDYALIDVGSRKAYTSSRIVQTIEEVANGLAKFEFPLETRIAIIAKNSFEYIATYHGIRRAGMVPVLINAKLPATKIQQIIQHSDSELIFHDGINATFDVPSINFHTEFSLFLSTDYKNPAPYDPNRPVLQIYTSGSTGEPKGVVISGNSRSWLIDRLTQNVSTCPVLVATPMYHMNGLTNVESCVISGQPLVLMPEFEPREYINCIKKYDVKILKMVPPMMAMILQQTDLLDDTYLNGIQEIVMASAPTSPVLFEKAKVRFPNAHITIGYGSTELGAGIFGSHPSGMHTPEMSVGYPRRSVEYKLVDGILHVKSPTMLTSYHKRDVPLTEDGFFNTGDKFRIDEDGFYFFEGRADDMFVCGGENIYPSEVEEIIERHPAVKEVTVIGLPDPIKGAKPYAFIVGDDGLTEKEIKDFVLANAPAYQHPRAVWFLDKMPLTASNKINRKELKEIARKNMQ